VTNTDSVVVGGSGPEIPVPRVSMISIVLAGSIRTMIEWCEFLSYGTAPALVFNIMFPNFDHRRRPELWARHHVLPVWNAGALHWCLVRLPVRRRHRRQTFAHRGGLLAGAMGGTAGVSVWLIALALVTLAATVLAPSATSLEH
jgi:hypothetical protein